MKGSPYPFQITNDIAVGVGHAIEVREDRRTVWFRREQVIQWQTKLLCELANRCMPLIYEFAAVFSVVSVFEIIPSGPTTTTQARVCFINCGVDTTSLQPISTGQSSQARSDYGDSRAGCDLSCTQQRCRQRQSGGRRGNRTNKLTTRHGGIVDGCVAPFGLSCCR